MPNDKTCPIGRMCSQDCMWSVWIYNQRRAACAIAVLAVRGTDDSVNTIEVKKDRPK